MITSEFKNSVFSMTNSVKRKQEDVEQVKKKIESRALIGKDWALFYNLPKSISQDLEEAGFVVKEDIYDKDYMKVYWHDENLNTTAK